MAAALTTSGFVGQLHNNNNNLKHTAMKAISPIIRELKLQCSDGILLAGQSWSTPDFVDRKNRTRISTKQGDDQTQQATMATRHRILCLHGWMDNCRSFHHLAPALYNHVTTTSSTPVEIVAIDFPGHGLSSHKSMDGPPILLAESAFYVNEALHQLDWDHELAPFTLIGHSMGAGIGCLYAAAFPEQVDKLVLLEGGGPLARNGQDVAKHVRQHVLHRRNRLQLNKPPRIYPSLEKAVEIRCQTAANFPGNQYLSASAAREMVIRGTRKVDETGGIQFVHDPRLQWPSVQYFTQEQVMGLYKDIQCPTALLQAKEGWPFDQDTLKKSMEILRPTVHKILPGSHHFHADPDTAVAVAKEVIQFLFN